MRYRGECGPLQIVVLGRVIAAVNSGRITMVNVDFLLRGRFDFPSSSLPGFL